MQHSNDLSRNFFMRVRIFQMRWFWNLRKRRDGGKLSEKCLLDFFEVGPYSIMFEISAVGGYSN